jgi:integral membrane protein
VGAALTRYRVIAYIVGVVLILFVAVAIPLKYIGDQPALGQVVAPAHGFLYMVYLVAVFDLGRRANWPLRRMVLLMLAGTIPFVSFYAERVVTRSAQEQPRDQDRTPEPIAG